MSERLVTREAQKAETAILRIRKAARDSIRNAETTWALKQRALYNEFPEDVLRVLLATGIIEEADLEPANVPVKR